MTLFRNNTILLQGLYGASLVGYHTVQGFLRSFKSESILIKKYPVYFPHTVIIDKGEIKLQALELWQTDLQDQTVYVLTGPQPDNDILASRFVLEFIEDLHEVELIDDIKLYTSFGAYLQDLPIYEFLKTTNFDPNTYLESMLFQSQELYVASKGVNIITELVPYTSIPVHLMNEGMITGLNGFLPGYIAAAHEVPSAALLVSTLIPPYHNPESPLIQFLGIQAALTGMRLIEDVLGIEINKDHYFELSRSLLSHASDELYVLMSKGSDEQDTGFDPSSLL